MSECSFRSAGFAVQRKVCRQIWGWGGGEQPRERTLHLMLLAASLVFSCDLPPAVVRCEVA